jgi:hypothetical protein
MKKLLIHNQTKSLNDLLDYTAINSQPDTYVRYMSEYEEQTSKKIKNDWDYYINPYGYRGHWQLKSDTKKIGFFGCSFTIGVGVLFENTFSNLVELHYASNPFYKVESINLGLPGSGIQRIAKLVSASVNVFNFDAVVLTLPSSTRFLISDEHNLMINIVPGFSKFNLAKTEKLIYKHLGNSTLDMYYVDYIHWINKELSSVPTVLWSSWDPHSYSLIKKVIKKDNILPLFLMKDKGRDDHPGILTHKLWSGEICKNIKLSK